MSTWNGEVLNLADLVILRRTVRIEVPDEDTLVVKGPLRYPELEEIPRDLVSTVDTQLFVHPDDPELVSITHLVSIIPTRLKEHIEAKAEAAHLAAFEQAADNIEEQ